MSTSDNNRNFDTIRLKHELQDLIHGNDGEGQENLIQTIARYLRRSKITSAGAKNIEYTKEQETKSLISFLNNNDLWYKKEIKEASKIGEGAEQKVYYDDISGTVIKLNEVYISCFGKIIFIISSYIIISSRQLSIPYWDLSLQAMCCML